jgi:hypothetical protein
VTAKLISGVNNYNDYLKLTANDITYKNNKKVGNFPLSQIQHITLIKDERKVLHKIQLLATDGKSVTIDLDEMELEPFLGTIQEYITLHYKTLINLND